MKIACLGYDDDISQLAQAALAAGHRVVAAFDVDWTPVQNLPIPPSTDEGWESLLHGTVADAVLVSSNPNSEARADQLRKLTQAGIPLLLVLPACEPIIGFELEMIRDDTKCPMVSFFPGIRHPAIERLADLIRQADSSPIGQVDQVVVERMMPRRDRATVMRQLARDLDLIRQLFGPIRQVSALGPAHDSERYDNLVLAMATGGEQLARWSVAPAEQEDESSLVLIGQRGRAKLALPADTRQWRLEIAGEEPTTFQGHNDFAQAIKEMEQALTGRETRPAWNDICRDMEVIDAVPFSLRRGRKIELYGEELSEASTFKGMMAAGSCGILMLVLLLFIVGSVIEGFRLPMRKQDRVTTTQSADESGNAESPRWHLLVRLWPVYPLVIFLLLQFLLTISKKPARGRTSQVNQNASPSKPPG